jgi:uroporphyrinogen-III synthase
MYRTVSHIYEPSELEGYDMMIFFSPAGIVSLKENLPNFVQGEVKIACFGPATAAAIKEAGLRLDLEAPTVSAPSMTMALEQYLAKENN